MHLIERLLPPAVTELTPFQNSPSEVAGLQVHKKSGKYLLIRIFYHAKQ